jgi:NADPH:quinone reductase-like Zn-dependent oxidoreductase
MQQMVIGRRGGPEVFRLERAPDPTPARDEVFIRVKAAGVNFADILARKGLYPDAPPPPCVVGYEVAGVVERIGEDADTDLIGQEVIALTRFGGYADVVSVPQSQVFPKPNQLTFAQGAALPVNYLTAYLLLKVMGGLKPTESVLIHNAGGGVGLAALDMACAIGATTIGTASAHKHAFLESRGLDHAIDYRVTDWTHAVKQFTQGRGVDLILDPLGAGHWRKSYRALRATGRLGMFGISSLSGTGHSAKLRMVKAILQTPLFHPLGLLRGNKAVFGVNLGHLWHERERLAHWMTEVLEGIDAGWVRPHVGQTFTLTDAGDAHQYIESRQNIGKVILTP